MSEKMNCPDCPANKFNNTFVDSSGKKSAKYVIVGEGPGKMEVVYKKPFMGEAGKYLFRKLESMDFKREDFYITNMVKCFIKNPSIDIVNNCKINTMEELEYLENKKIMLILGGKAFEAFDLSAQGITANSGRVFWSDRFNCAILPCIHPASVLYDKTGAKEELFNLSISFMLYAKIVIETFGNLKVLSNEDSKEIIQARQKLKQMYAGQELFSHRGEQIFEQNLTSS